MSDDPRHDSPGSDPDPTGEWDHASAARRVANEDARRLKRTVRPKRKKSQDPDWDASTNVAPVTAQSELDQKLLEVEKRFRSQEAKSSSRRSNSKSRRKPSAFSRYAKKAGTAALAVAGLILLTYMVIVAIRPPSAPSVGGSPAGAQLEILPSLRPAAPLAADPGKPKNYTIVSSGDPRFDPVKKTITDFLTAKSPEERLPLLRPTPDVSAHLAASQKSPLLELGLTPTFGPAFIVSGNFVYAEIIEAGIGTRGAILENIGARYLIDFDSLVGYSEADWHAVANMQIESPITTRALIKIIPNGKSPIPGTEVAYVSDPGQNTTFPAAVAVLDIKDEHIVGALSTGQLLPFVITLSRVEHDGSPLLLIDEIVYSGWFEKNLFE